MNISWITDAVAGQVPSVPPDSPALAIGTADPLSYAELRERELVLATALRRDGVRPGDRVALLLRNCTDYVALYLALGRIGAISVRLNWRLTAAELSYQLRDSAASTVIFDAEFGERLAGIRDEVPARTYVARAGSDAAAPGWAVPLEEFAFGGADGEFPDVGPDEPLTLMYTSGTTGRPKGALLSHRNAVWIGTIQALSWKFDRTTVALTQGPLFHAGGFEVLLLPALLRHGTAVTFPSGGFTLESMLAAARRHSATAMLVYSFMLAEFGGIDGLEALVPPSLRRIVTGGDTIMPWVYDVVEKRLPGVNLTQSYSLTEGGAVALHLDHTVARGRETSVGVPQPMTQVRIVDPLGTEVPTGEVGEIHLRSPGVGIGYWNRPEETAETFAGGWCRTGDLGRVDADGFVTLAGRAKDMIRTGGENVYPAEVEKVLTGHPGVHDAALIGVPDAKLAEVGCAVVVAEPGASPCEEDLRRYLAERLAKYKIPRYFAFVRELPRTASGKVVKYLMKETYANLGERLGAPAGGEDPA
ncbi:class I adenylate-forming enzyme family protein [Amycolatopsis sp. Poz14]|uniref:class I adenylate-forming enzyme family protein n=1 Tax=Amycolatopsis sp. Poz14 TaxID=1447705 RepID=UPI001EE90FCA|nr:class I adenylate-forming enzyme family protein [Amycolatopsis sp. Poz14]MCG3754522.1 acyl--CoA ligase [Amycolatopsis sp. Poz14]